MGRHHLQGKLQTKHNNMNLLILLLCLNIAIFNSCGQEAQLSQIFEPPAGQRCRGRNSGDRRYCTPGDPCDEGEGDCDGPGDGGQHDGHAGCRGDLVCGSNNCLKFGAYYHEKDDCCEKPQVNTTQAKTTTPRKRPSFNPNLPTFFRPLAFRCAGREVDQGRCCSEAAPCVAGEGDCDGDRECEDGLVCGDNNCRQFGAFFHEKDDCCVKPNTEKNPAANSIFEWGPWEAWTTDKNGEKKRLRYQLVKDSTAQETPSTTEPILDPSIPFEPKAGQRCSGRNYQGRRCRTPENPCDEGEGDCDGPGDGGQNDGHRGCRGDLVCGSNNCKKFGHYYHEKDDCCERPRTGGSSGSWTGGSGSGGQWTGWAQWSSFSSCSARCGLGTKKRTRLCTGPECGTTFHTQETQERPCVGKFCGGGGGGWPFFYYYLGK